MKHQTYDLRNLDERAFQLLVDIEIDEMLEGKLCTLCNEAFLTRDEKDNARVTGKNPLTFAHNECWIFHKMANK